MSDDGSIRRVIETLPKRRVFPVDQDHVSGVQELESSDRGLQLGRGPENTVGFVGDGEAIDGERQLGEAGDGCDGRPDDGVGGAMDDRELRLVGEEGFESGVGGDQEIAAVVDVVEEGSREVWSYGVVVERA